MEREKENVIDVPGGECIIDLFDQFLNIFEPL